LLLANQFHLFNQQTSQILLASIILSMMVAPIIVRHNGNLAKRLVPGYTHAGECNLDVIRAEADVTDRHVIVCGYGRSGQNLAWMLEQEGVPNLALDLDPIRVRDARDAGKPVAYGDVTPRTFWRRPACRAPRHWPSVSTTCLPPSRFLTPRACYDRTCR